MVLLPVQSFLKTAKKTQNFEKNTNFASECRGLKSTYSDPGVKSSFKTNRPRSLTLGILCVIKKNNYMFEVFCLRNSETKVILQLFWHIFSDF